MRFKLDENVALVVRDILRERGDDAITLHEEGFSGSPDEDVRGLCRREHRIIVTFDLGFSDGRLMREGNLPGAIVLRLRRQDPTSVASAFRRFCSESDPSVAEGRIVVVEESRSRVFRG